MRGFTVDATVRLDGIFEDRRRPRTMLAAVVGSSLLATVAALGGCGEAQDAAEAAAIPMAVASHPVAFDPVSASAFIDANCVSCHNESDWAGGLLLGGDDLTKLGSDQALWERVAQRVGGGEMPPAAADNKPEPEEAAAFSEWLVAELDEYALAHPDPGRPLLRRMNRAEYNNAVRDLLSIELDVKDLLPPDTVVGGFTNNAEAMSVSPLVLEKYLSVARQVARRAVGDPSLPRTIYDFPVPDNQTSWAPGLPFGARGGVAVEHYFPISGEYVIRAVTDRPSKLPATPNVRSFEIRARIPAGSHSVVLTIADDLGLTEGSVENIRSAAALPRPGAIDPVMSLGDLPLLDIRIAGQRLALLEIQPPSLRDVNTQNGLYPGQAFINRVEVDGPFNPEGPGATPSRQSIFICEPESESEEASCAREILTSVVRRAFRRDVEAADVQPFLDAYVDARAATSFERGIQEALQAVLVAPEFLFRVEADPEGVAPDAVFEIDDFALASRLSFFLWSSIPDEELLDIASARRLSEPEVVDEQVRRMLRDPRASALVDNFGMEFLGLAGLDTLDPDPAEYPGFTRVLKNELREETRLFLQSVFANNASVTDLVGAGYTYLNENLARHYGVEDVYGPQFRRVNFEPGSGRGGVLAQGSVLLATSHPAETSPVMRGKWVLANLLNSPPSPPPPGVPALEPIGATGERLTAREQLERHRTDPQCSGCHARMDPYGFALENFDVVGAWRDHDEGGPINAHATMPDGAAFDGVDGLRSRLLSNDRALAVAFTGRLFSYALGRQLEGQDHPVVRRIVDQSPGYRFEDIVAAIIASDSFQMKRAPEPS